MLGRPQGLSIVSFIIGWKRFDSEEVNYTFCKIDATQITDKTMKTTSEVGLEFFFPLEFGFPWKDVFLFCGNTSNFHFF